MKSPMIENAEYIKHKECYSELQVLNSGGGYYVGTIYTDPLEDYQEPGSRDSSYFATYDEAAALLAEIEAGDKKALRQLRTHP